MGLGFQPTEYVDVSEAIETKTAMLEAHQSQLTWLGDPRRRRHRRADAGGHALPRPPMRRRVRRGVRPLPYLAAREHQTSFSRERMITMVTQVRVRLRHGPFHQLPRPGCLPARPEDHAGGAHTHPNPEFKIRIIDEPGDFYHAFATDLVGRIREARDAGRRFVALLPVGTHAAV